VNAINMYPAAFSDATKIVSSSLPSAVVADFDGEGWAVSRLDGDVATPLGRYRARGEASRAVRVWSDRGVKCRFTDFSLVERRLVA